MVLDPSASAAARRDLVDVIVLSGGDPVEPSLATELPPDAFVIAADGGLALADPLGLHVDLLVGDLDSVDADQVAAAEAAGTQVERYPTDKDATDLAISLAAALGAGADRITIVGGAGGRADHLLANWLLLAGDALAERVVRAWSTSARTDVVRPGRTTWLEGDVGSLISLLPVQGTAIGVTTSGLRYPLDGETLQAGSSRGVSNRFAATSASVDLQAGVLLAVQPRTHTGGTT